MCYFYFDNTHPTAPIQLAAFNDINRQFDLAPVAAAVPEPSTWVMLIIGFGAIGFSIRRARKVTPALSPAYSDPGTAFR